MGAYETATLLGLTGTDAQIVNQLQPLTVRDIKSDDAVEWLAEGGYWQTGPGGMTGTLVAVYTASTGAARKKLDDAWLWLYGVNAKLLRTTRPSQADRVLFLINQIPGVTNAIRNAFYDLGGTRPYRTLTVAEFAADRDAFNAATTAAAAKALLQTQWATAQNDGGINTALAAGNRVALVAALRAAATSLEAG